MERIDLQNDILMWMPTLANFLLCVFLAFKVYDLERRADEHDEILGSED